MSNRYLRPKGVQIASTGRTASSCRKGSSVPKRPVLVNSGTQESLGWIIKIYLSHQRVGSPAERAGCVACVVCAATIPLRPEKSAKLSSHFRKAVFVVEIIKFLYPLLNSEVIYCNPFVARRRQLNDHRLKPVGLNGGLKVSVRVG